MSEDQTIGSDDTGYIDAFAIGISGQLYGKREPARMRDRLLSDGLNMSACALLFDARGVNPTPEGIGGADGDPDANAKVIGNLVPVPWAKMPTQQCLLELRDAASGERFWYDPRKILDDVIARLNADGLFPVVACELEFYLISATRKPDGSIAPANLRRTGAPPVSEGNFSLALVEDYADFLAEIAEAARQQGVPVGTAISEYGIGQFEINLDHSADPLAAADQAVLLRRIVTGVARARGDDATFMAKPFIEQPGSGMHIHVSLVDADGNNRMAGEGGLLHPSIAGLQRTLAEGMGFFGPNFSSYRRLKPKMFVPMDTSWGHNNRSVAFRVPTGSDTSRRVEHRVAGADASPHLVLAAVLAGMHAGIAGKWQPTPETKGFSEGNGSVLPRNLIAAMDRLAGAEILADYIPHRFLDLYRDNRMGEFEGLFSALTPAEYDFYL
ncbi:glutamine synthetase family protein [Pararhizobium sp.]|uniref:glutamine synthetase family protein n=1 Tax=Pararhizobium sp. TaxID=1977563 RepID=UPI00271C83D7|nr:glutamine synthetase family protein [Pararhizobium sp.]MDO9416169.1 glutamine synthetase family protein [Pararhizobium sp.]